MDRPFMEGKRTDEDQSSVQLSPRTRHTTDVKNYQNGVLVLTNHRLISLETHGKLSKSYDVAFEVPLEDLRGLSMGGTVFKHGTITDNIGPHVFHLEVGERISCVQKDDIVQDDSEEAVTGPAEEAGKGSRNDRLQLSTTLYRKRDGSSNRQVC